MSRGSEAKVPPDGGGSGPGQPASSSLDAASFGHLSAALAHELRNPLNAMSIHLELLEGRLGRGGDGSGARSLQAIREGIARVDATLERFLSAAGAREAERDPAPIRELLAAAAARAADRAAAAGVNVVIITPEEAGGWPLDAPAVGVALDALIDNAIRASRPGSSVRLLAFRLGEGGERGEIRVEDEGAGMSREALAQAGRIGVSTCGRAGVGLAVARQAVKGHGGSLQLSSEGPGRGTTATIQLPLDD